MTISIHKNAISEDLAKICVDELENKLNMNVWKCSAFDWEKNIQHNITGSCFRCEISDTTSDIIMEQISKYVPKKFDDLNFQFVVWQSHSGLSMHNDAVYYFAATIYLNEFWHPNWGGLFLWNSSDQKNEDYDDQWKVIVPQYRSLIINESNKDHLVTHLSPTTPKLRYTIQIFSVKE